MWQLKSPLDNFKGKPSFLENICEILSEIEELLEKRCRVPNEKLGPHLGHFRKICPGQNPMEDGSG